MSTEPPTSATEPFIREDQLIISQTDCKGRFIYVNHDFIEVSGFTEQELIGASLNLVYPSDILLPIFDDQWKSIKGERPWTGLLKIRCKNGDFCWVECNISPVWKDGSAIGYFAMSRKPTPTQIAAAETANARLLAGKPAKWWLSRVYARINDAFISHAIPGALRTMVLFFILAVVMALIGLKQADNQIHRLSKQLQSLEQAHNAPAIQSLQALNTARSVLPKLEDPTTYSTLNQAEQNFQQELKTPYDQSMPEISALGSIDAVAVPERQALVLSFIGIIFAGLIGVWLTRKIQIPLRETQTQLQAIVEGNYHKRIAIENQDEFGELLLTLYSVQARLYIDQLNSKRAAEHSLSFQTGLDNATSNIMIVDQDNYIIYHNKALHNTFCEAAVDIRQDWPDFDPNKLIGTNIDSFHKDPQRQRNLLDQLSGTHRATIKLGGRTFALIISPVVNAEGARLSTTVEWVDQTEETAHENEIDTIVRASTHPK
jgi:methyl-accepting chemotaxis protein